MTAAADVRQRRIGIAVLLLLAIAVAGLQLARGRRHKERDLDLAFAALASAAGAPAGERPAAWQRASRHFGRAAAVVSLEPLALAGASLVAEMPVQWGQAPPAAPPPQQASDEAVARHLRALLVRGLPADALAYGSHPLVAPRRGPVAVLVRFAAAWQQATTAANMPPPPAGLR